MGESTIDLCGVDEVVEGEPLKVTKGGVCVAVYRVGDQVFVTDDHCTHGPGSLSEGFQEEHVIECDFHGGAFDIRTGAVVEPPCMIPIKTYQVAQNEGRVVITVEEQPAQDQGQAGSH